MAGSDKKRVIIITGASRGLGRALALRFGREGERVVVNFLSNERAARAVADEVISEWWRGNSLRCQCQEYCRN